MNINWNKWVTEQLPLALRVQQVLALLLVLVSPVRQLYDEYMQWRTRMRKKLSYTPQTCMLKKIIEDETGIKSVSIIEADGKPVDFRIITKFDDNDTTKRLFSLLDRYKLAGKNYRYQATNAITECLWSHYLCETNSVAAQWTSYFCENISLEATWNYLCETDPRANNLVTVILYTQQQVIGVTTAHRAYSDLTIAYTVKHRYSGVTEARSLLYKTTDSGQVHYPNAIDWVNEELVEGSINLSPRMDLKYHYTLKITNEYGDN